MTAPPTLIKGDTIGIVAPAGKIDKEIILKAKEVLEGWGLNVEFGKHIFNSNFSFSGTDAVRLEDFQLMINNPSIKAIICARGGYGTARIIDQLDFANFRINPKWIIGFSDITVLHNHIQQNFDIETIHGTMAAGLTNTGKFPETVNSLIKALFGESLNYNWATHPLSRRGICNGILTGGNLAMLCSLFGTSSEVDMQGKILFIEEIGENLYKIDRMMVQLKRAGKLKDLAGLVVGGMTNIPDTKEDFGKTTQEIVLDAVKEYDYPVCFGFHAGHQNDNRSMIMGRTATLEVDQISTLNFEPKTLNSEL